MAKFTPRISDNDTTSARSAFHQTASPRKPAAPVPAITGAIVAGLFAGQALHQGGAAGLGRAEAQDRRAGGLRQRPRAAGMVQMGMGDQDMADPARAGRRQDRGAMGGQVRAGVDHRDYMRERRQNAVRKLRGIAD